MSGKIPFWITTHWSMIFAAGKPQHAEGVTALNRLLETYRLPCTKHLQHGFTIPIERAEDWFHDFVKNKIMERDLISTADPLKGRFRDLLRASLTRFGIDKSRSESKQSQESPLHELPEHFLMALPSSNDPFTTQWIKTLLNEASEMTRHHYEKKNRLAHWQVFQEGFALPKINGTKAPSRKSLAVKYDFDSESQTNNIILNVCRYYRQAVLSLITSYCQSDRLIEEEWESIQCYLSNTTPSAKKHSAPDEV